MKWLITAGAVFLLLAILSAYLGRAKCPNCKSRKTYEIKRTELESEPKLFKETVRSKVYDNVGNSRTNFGQRAASNQYAYPPKKIITQEVIVEGKRTWYRVQYQCAKCNTKFSEERYVDTKPEIN